MLQRRHMTAVHYNRPNTKAQKGDINNEGLSSSRQNRESAPRMAQPRGILPRKLPRKVRKGEIKSSLATLSVNFALGTWGLSPPLARRTTSHPQNHTELRDKASESEERAPQKNPKHGIRDRRIRGRGRSRRAHLGGGSTGAAEAEAETRCQHPSRSRAPLAFVGRRGGGGDTETE